MDDIKKKILISLFIVFMIFPIYAYAAKGVLSDQAKVCLTCHTSKGINKMLENKEVLSLYIDKDEFLKSVHNSIDCSGCHTGFMAAHFQKKKQINSKKEYTVNTSRVCSMCHLDDQLKKIPTHSSLMTKAACVECHGSHYIKKMAEWKKSVNEVQYCLMCHMHDLSMHLESRELLSLSINESAYKSSMHRNLLCSACHTDFSTTKHPVRTFKNKKEYSALATKSCSMCHTEQQLRKSPVHSSLMVKTACVQCHGSHSIKGVAAQKAGLGQTQYCLSCHKSQISMPLKNGESLSVFVDESALRNSAHGKLECAKCHSDFSKTQHPVRTFNSIRDYFIAGTELCKKCHSETYIKYEDSIHYTMLKSGNPKAPTCANCHGVAHAIVVRTKSDKTLGLTSCNKCHEDMKASYEASIHYQLMVKGNKNAPVCSSCHNAHDIQDTSASTKIKAGCLGCHKNTEKLHNKWLKNPPITLPSFAETHFDVVSCSACHSAGATRGIYLSLYNRGTGKPLQEEELLKLLETDSAGLMGKIDTNGDGFVEAREIWDFSLLLYRKGATSIFMGKMNVGNAVEAHMISGKAEATKDCVKCHQPGAEFFQDIFIAIQKADGKRSILKAKPDVLNSVYTILPVSKFYAIGSSSITLFDILFIIALIGGIAVPIGHISLRIITSPLRSLRRMGKGGKK
jgi:hypothetical protein